MIAFDKQGHRGARGLMPENTIPSMFKAIDLGVTTLEMDLAVTRDKRIIVSHDPHFNHFITTNPEGSALTEAEASKLLFYQMNYEEISKYDVGLRPHPLFPKQQRMAVAIPLLSDLVREAELYSAKHGRKLFYNIEIKSLPHNDGFRHPPVEEFVDLAIDIIESLQISERTIIQSFDVRALQIMHKKYPAVKTSLLIEDDDKRSIEEQLDQLGFIPSVYSPHYSLVSDTSLKYCHDKKMLVIPWTVNDLEEMNRLKELGVDGIISDYPDLFSKL